MASRPPVQATLWLATLGPHLYCCGHVHTAWAFAPQRIPNQLCLNSGAPLLRDHKGDRPPGFLEVVLTGPDVVDIRSEASELEQQGIVPVFVPDHDPDHRGTVYEDERAANVEPIC